MAVDAAIEAASEAASDGEEAGVAVVQALLIKAVEA